MIDDCVLLCADSSSKLGDCSLPCPLPAPFHIRRLLRSILGASAETSRARCVSPPRRRQRRQRGSRPGGVTSREGGKLPFNLPFAFLALLTPSRFTYSIVPSMTGRHHLDQKQHVRPIAAPTHCASLRSLPRSPTILGRPCLRRRPFATSTTPAMRTAPMRGGCAEAPRGRGGAAMRVRWGAASRRRSSNLWWRRWSCTTGIADETSPREFHSSVGRSMSAGAGRTATLPHRSRRGEIKWDSDLGVLA